LIPSTQKFKEATFFNRLLLKSDPKHLW